MATGSKTLEYYMGLTYEIVIKRSDGGWFARVSDLPGCMTWADSYEELGPMIEDAKRGYIEVALRDGDPVPEPLEDSLEGYSGKANLRMPRSLHRDLARRAEAEGVSLNQVMVATLVRAISQGIDTQMRETR